MRAIDLLRQSILTEEFDYLQLMQALDKYKKPRDAATRLLKTGAIIRVKKGLYVFGQLYRRGSICIESLANLIYGPSYLSLEYALQYYNMIPERVEQITSMTVLKNKDYNTPLGMFVYEHLNLEKYSVGITQIDTNSQHQFLIASPEKALADRIASHKNLETAEEVYSFVCQGMRIEEESLKNLDESLLEDIATIYRNSAVSALSKLVKDLSC